MNNQVWTIIEDDAGNIWVGTKSLGYFAIMENHLLDLRICQDSHISLGQGYDRLQGWPETSFHTILKRTCKAKE